jgi:hypothetical protein
MGPLGLPRRNQNVTNSDSLDSNKSLGASEAGDNGRDNQLAQSAGRVEEDFDLDSLRVRVDYSQQLVVKDILAPPPIRKPKKKEFFRTHPDYEFAAVLITATDTDEEFYVIDPSLHRELADEAIVRVLIPCINRENVVFLCPIGTADEEGRLNSWHASAYEVCQTGKQHWVRRKSNRSAGVYTSQIAVSDLGGPSWPTMDGEEIVRKAFYGRIINDLDHPIVRKLRGIE